MKGFFWLIVMLCAVAFGCSTPKTSDEAAVISQLLGRMIDFSGTVFTACGKVVDCGGKRMSILLYVDSSSCVVCKTKPYLWTHFVGRLDALTDNGLGFRVVFGEPNKSKVQELISKNGFVYPAFIDEKMEFKAKNGLGDDSRFHCFLLDSLDRVILVGNPALNEKVRELYEKKIFETFGITGAVTEQQRKRVKSLGTFKWTDLRTVSVLVPNPTDTLWQVDSLYTSCECTTARISKREIESKDNATVTITYKADAPGEFMREVYLDINGEDAKLTLAIEGKAE